MPWWEPPDPDFDNEEEWRNYYDEEARAKLAKLALAQVIASARIVRHLDENPLWADAAEDYLVNVILHLLEETPDNQDNPTWAL